MVNIGGSFLLTLVALADILGALWYLALSIGHLTVSMRLGTANHIAVRVRQVITGPIALFLSGVILFFQGWRLDPILQFQQLLMTILVFYHAIRDLRQPPD